MKGISDKDMASRIQDYYYSFYLDKSGAIGSNTDTISKLHIPSTLSLERVVDKGDLESMIYPFFCVNSLAQIGDLDGADHLLSTFISGQMVNLMQHLEEPVRLYLVNLSKGNSTSVKRGTLREVEPYIELSIRDSTFPFLDPNRDSVFSVMDYNNRVLYVNPQVLNSGVNSHLVNFMGSKDKSSYAEVLRHVHGMCFGRRNIDAVMPWLKKGLVKKAKEIK